MGFTDLFRPKWKHSDPEVRADAVRQLGEDQADLLATIVRQDPDARVRRLALKRVADPALLRQVAREDGDDGLRAAAAEKADELLLAAALGDDAAAAGRALPELSAARLVAQVAQKSPLPEQRARAVERLAAADEQKALAEVARHAPDLAIRKRAVELVTDLGALREVAIIEASKEVALVAVARLDDRAALEKVAQKAHSKAVRQAARDKLPQTAGPAAQPVSPEAERRAKRVQVCRAIESASEPADADAAKAAWSELGPLDHKDPKDEELWRRYERGLERFYARRSQQARVQSARAHVVKAEAAPAATAPTAPTEAPVAEAPAPEPDPEALARAAEAAAREAEAAAVAAARREEEQKRREEAERRRAEERAAREAAKEEAQQRRAAAAAANLVRLGELVAQIEKLAEGDPKRAANGLKRVEEAHGALGPLPRAEAEPLEERWRAARDKLRARLAEEREAEQWKRWANVPKLEALCVRVEALLEATDQKHTAAELKKLQAEWKTVGPATRERSAELWTRFKAAADQVHERSRAYFSSLGAERTVNLTKKQELCARVEAVADSSDWKETGDLIKALQEEWKAIGPVPKTEADAVWKRFRAACDRFFERRGVHFGAQDAERQGNLERQIALCEKAEALGQSVEWQKTANELKRLQAEWKRVGPVPKDKAEEAWKRFRAACDVFFTRRQGHFAELDGERQEALKAKELLCEKAEALVEAPDPQEAIEGVKALNAEWRTIGPAPKDKADEVWKRFRAACDRVFARVRQPEPVHEPTAGYAAPKLGDLFKSRSDSKL